MWGDEKKHSDHDTYLYSTIYQISQLNITYSVLETGYHMIVINTFNANKFFYVPNALNNGGSLLIDGEEIRCLW